MISLKTTSRLLNIFALFLAFISFAGSKTGLMESGQSWFADFMARTGLTLGIAIPLASFLFSFLWEKAKAPSHVAVYAFVVLINMIVILSFLIYFLLII